MILYNYIVIHVHVSVYILTINFDCAVQLGMGALCAPGDYSCMACCGMFLSLIYCGDDSFKFVNGL